MQALLKRWTHALLEWLGVTSSSSDAMDRWVAFALVVLTALLIDLFLQLIVVRGIRRLVERTRVKWDDRLFSVPVLNRSCHVVIAVLLTAVLPVIFDEQSVGRIVVLRMMQVFIVFTFLRLINALLCAAFHIVSLRPDWQNKPIKGLRQTAQGFFTIVAVILIVAILIDKSPVKLLTGLGASAAVLMLVFRDSIMGFVSGIQLSANNMQLLDAKRTRESLVYGKIFVDMNTTVKGPLSSLSMRGDLRLLGGTNVTYVMQDSPLTVQDRLSGLVSFVSFAEDSVRRRRPLRESLPLGGMDMLLTIGIDQAVQANVDLTPDKSSHVNLEGGGDLSFQYTPLGEMVLSGRYTLSGGTVRYSLPVIPLKDFSIQEGSYVQWSGDVMDPTLNLRATERIRTSVTSGENSTRMVNFDVGIALTQRLENLGLQFILEAPEDAAMQEELARMGEEEKAKQAVSMLVTGMYLAGGSSGTKTNLNMGDALNSFLQSEINNIAGSALKTIDINFGMESYDEDGDGSKRTDYSFRFAKRFYNDRIRVVLGGRISTGADINQGQAQPFIDDVSIEYRLDASGTRYVKLFHNKDYESLLEGELTETGAGIVLRKKMKRMRELFIFRRNKPKEEKMAEPASSESN